MKLIVWKKPWGWEQLVEIDGAIGRLPELLAFEDRSMYLLDPLGKFDWERAARELPESPMLKVSWSAQFGTPWDAPATFVMH